MDTSFDTNNPNKYTNNNNAPQRPQHTTPARTKQSTYQGFRPKPIHVWNGESYQIVTTSPAHARENTAIPQEIQ